MNDKCPKCGGSINYLAGESAHPSNWYCEDEQGCGWVAWEPESSDKRTSDKMTHHEKRLARYVYALYVRIGRLEATLESMVIAASNELNSDHTSRLTCKQCGCSPSNYWVCGNADCMNGFDVPVGDREEQKL